MKNAGSKLIITTVGLPITGTKADQTLIRRLDRLVKKLGLRARTELLRRLIAEAWAREYPAAKAEAK